MKSKFFKKFFKPKKKSKINEYLQNSDIDLKREEYLSIVLRSFIIFFIGFFIFSNTLLFFLKSEKPIIYSLIFSILFSGFIFFSQIIYAKVYANRKQKNIERNLIPALEDMVVQLSSGVSLFDILVNISNSDYGELSKEFKKAVRKINAGFPQVEVLEELSIKNPSHFFRRTLWQLSNGMKAGSDIKEIVKDSIKTLHEEQILQMQSYGSRLNPLVMFYMLIAVILPALSITFLTIISSIINLSKTITISMFIGLYIIVVLIEISFMGIIKSSKPSLV